jgi:hypothetical protein
MGDSRSATALTLATGTTDAYLIENGNGNDLIAVTTSNTPGSTTIDLGNLTDAPVITLTGSVILQDVTDYTQSSGPFDCTTSGLVDVGDGAVCTITMNPGTGGFNVELLDNDAGNFSVGQGAAEYLRVDTTNGSERVTIGDVGATCTSDLIAGNDVNISAGSDVDIQPGSFGTSATALRIRDGATLANVYLLVDTATPRVQISGASNARVDFGGTGALGKPDASGTNAAGSDLHLNAGAGTGNATAGLLYFGTPAAGASGTTVQTITDRLIMGGSSTSSTILFGNPNTSNQAATPVATAQILATTSNTTAQGSDLTIRAGDVANFGGAGDGGTLTLEAGSTLGVGPGGDAILAAGNSNSGVGGTLRLQTGNTSSAVDRLTIGPTGDVGLTEQSSTAAMPTHYWQRYRVTHNSAAQTVLTYSVPSGASLYADVRAVWNRSSATTGAATATVFGGCWNDGGTTDEIGGATVTGTALRSGQASTDSVNVQIVADNGTDELQIQLTKSNANDYTVDLFVLVHATA